MSLSTYLLGAALSVQILMWFSLWRGYRRATRDAEESIQAFSQKKAEESAGSIPGAGAGYAPGVSIIVAARNEESSISRVIDSLISQDYPCFEIIVVDDHSTDDTRDHILAAKGVRYVLNDGKGKKSAITTGVKASRYPVCLFTDADCAPGPTWIQAHVRFHAGHPKTVVVGLAPLRVPGGLLGLFQAYDAMLNQFMAAAQIGNKKAYMATGRNLSYSRTLFDEVGGLERHRDVLSGDDDILIQDIRTRTSANIFWSDESDIQVKSDGKFGWSDWFRQKRRHASAGRYFVSDVTVWHGVFFLSLLGVVALSLFEPIMGAVALALLWCTMALSIFPAHKRFGRPFSLGWIPILSLISVAYGLVVPALGLFIRPSEWQSR